jgi:hypothetical protein
VAATALERRAKTLLLFIAPEKVFVRPGTMPLRAGIARLAHGFVGLYAYLRNEFGLWRDVERNFEALRARSAAETQSTAIHEAGHAALGIAMDLDLFAVSIIPDLRDGTAGGVFFKKGAVTAGLQMVGREAFYLRHAMFYYAGAEAIRQLIPTDANPDAGADCDKLMAAKLIVNQIGGNGESLGFLLSLAKRRCALLVAHFQPEIWALAGVLKEKRILSGKTARKVFMRSLRQRAGRMMIFATDPMLNGLACDEDFQSFLRRLNIPGRPH